MKVMGSVFLRATSSLLAVAVISSLFVAPSFAQGSDNQADEVIVTAQFRAQNLQDTPIAITSVTGEMLEARSQTDVTQIAQQAPNVLLTQNGDAYGASMVATIRGIGASDFNPALEPGVGIYVDDVYYATLTGGVMDLLDLERLEILRGPQGTLSGRNSIGGAIKMYSKRPGSGEGGYLAAAYGSRNRIDLRGGVDFNITEGVDMRLSGVNKRQKGYVERLDFGCVNPPGQNPDINPANGIPAILPPGAGSCVLSREGEVNYSAVRGQLRLRPSDSIDINIIGDYTYDDRAGTPSVIIPLYDDSGNIISPNRPVDPRINPYGDAFPLDSRWVCGQFCNYANFRNPASGNFAEFSTDGRTRFEGWGVSGQIDWTLADNLALTSITAYRTYDSSFTNEDLTPLAGYLGLSILDFWFFSQEIRLNGSLGENEEIQYTVGGYYSDQESVYTARQEFRDSIGAFFQRDPVPMTTKAVFGHVAWNTPIEGLTLNGGLRYTKEKKTYTFLRTTPLGAPHPILGGLTEARGVYDAGQWDYRANLQYRWSSNLMTYAQVATGYKGGGINPRPFQPQQAIPVGTEKLTGYEIGLKSDLFDRRLRLNVAGFLSKYKDIQLTTSACPPALGIPCLIVANAGDAEMKGFEVEASLRPADGLMIDASFSHLDFDYTRLATGVTGTTGPRLTDDRPFSPAWKWSAGVQYRADLGNAGSLTPRVDVSYQGRAYMAPRNEKLNEIQAFTIANARLTWRNVDEDLEASLEVTNIFDLYYFRTGSTAVDDPTFISGQPGRPREWAISVKKKF